MAKKERLLDCCLSLLPTVGRFPAEIVRFGQLAAQVPTGGQEEAGCGEPLLTIHYNGNRTAGQPLEADGVDVVENKALVCWTAGAQTLRRSTQKLDFVFHHRRKYSKQTS